MDKQLITIDYLIINLEGKLQKNLHENPLYENFNNFSYELAERGTKTFASVYQVFYNNIRFGTLLCNPHKGSVLAEDFAQFQFDNALFYTQTLPQLGELLSHFIDATDYKFKSVNRLDIALDRVDNGYYAGLAKSLNEGSILLAGRKKKIQFFNETEKGNMVFTGMTVGKRSAARLLRIYNKTRYLLETPKDYVDKWHSENGLNGEIWRFEYQLNAAFFRELHQTADASFTAEHNPKFKCINEVAEKMTWGIFKIENLVELLRLAEKNHFELRENTGKSQVNKERSVISNAWVLIKKALTTVTASIKKIPKIIDRSPVIKKRLAKSLFREYYVSFQDISFVIALNKLLHENELVNWFDEKMKYYLAEFHTKERIKDTFDFKLYDEHSNIFI